MELQRLKEACEQEEKGKIKMIENLELEKEEI